MELATTPLFDEVDNTMEWKRIDLDKASWGSGPWINEPDKMQWVDKTTGLDCIIVRNRYGSLCGYVGVPENHLWFALSHEQVGEVDVHGGITFSGLCDEMSQPWGICHIPLPGRPERVWWLGFDCGHAGDIDPTDVQDRELWLSFGYQYRDLTYVRGQCAFLAAQLMKVSEQERVEG